MASTAKSRRISSSMSGHLSGMGIKTTSRTTLQDLGLNVYHGCVLLYPLLCMRALDVAKVLDLLLHLAHICLDSISLASLGI